MLYVLCLSYKKNLTETVLGFTNKKMKEKEKFNGLVCNTVGVSAYIYSVECCVFFFDQCYKLNTLPLRVHTA